MSASISRSRLSGEESFRNLLDLGGSGQNAGGIQIGPADELRIAGGRRGRNVQDLQVVQDVVVDVIVPRRLLEDRLLQLVREGNAQRAKR